MVKAPKIRRNDTVMVCAGASAGKTGKVLQVIRGKGRALVEGANTVKKTLRKSQDNPQGGIVERENPIALSNLMLFCPQCKKGVRAGRVVDGEKKGRKCKSCGHLFED